MKTLTKDEILNTCPNLNVFWSQFGGWKIGQKDRDDDVSVGYATGFMYEKIINSPGGQETIDAFLKGRTRKDALDKAVDYIIAEEAKRNAAEAAEKAARLSQVRKDALECWRRIAGEYADCLPLVEDQSKAEHYKIGYICDRPGYRKARITFCAEHDNGKGLYRVGDLAGLPERDMFVHNPVELARAFRSLRIEETPETGIPAADRIAQLQDEIAELMERQDGKYDSFPDRARDKMVLNDKRRELAALQGSRRMSRRDEVISILKQAKGDDLYRAKMAFKGLPEDEMQKEYGVSGKTRAQIIAEYEKHDARIDDLIKWVAEVWRLP